MATITGALVNQDDRVEVATWTNLVQATSDVGKGIRVAHLQELVVQAFGTNATTVEIQGSNDGVTYNALGAGVTLTIGASGSSPATALTVKPLYIRPATPSAGADTDVVLVGRRGV